MRERIKGFFRGGKHRVSLTVLTILALTLPAAVALTSFYSENLKNSKIAGDLMTVSVYDEEKNLLHTERDSRTAAPQNSLVGIFDSILREMTPLEEILPQPGKSILAVIEYNGEKRELVCYFSKNEGESFCVEGYETAYRISDADCAVFLSTVFSETLYDSATPPRLYNAYGDAILPKTCEWRYKTIFGKYYSSTLSETTPDVLTYTMAGELGLYFDKAPDSAFVRVYEENALIFEGAYPELSGVTVGAGKTLSFSVDAVWHESSETDYAGSQSYDFLVLMRDLSEFSITKEAVVSGEIFVISGTNIDDVSKIKLDFEPPINFSPKFFTDGNKARCIIPLTGGNLSDTLRITVTYGAAKEIFDLALVPHEEKSTFNFEFSKPFSDFSEIGFLSILKIIGSAVQDKIFIKNSFAEIDAKKFAAGYSYGDILEYDDASYSPLGCEFISDVFGQSVTSLNAGEVVYVGKSDFSGYTIIIDHGFGIKTVYSRLGFVAVSKGDYVAKGDILGQTGDNAITGNHGFVLYCTVFDEIVDPDSVIGKDILKKS